MELRSRNKVSAAFSMSSMTDLVFLLLIFFIIVSTLVSPFALPVDLPSGQSSSSSTPTVTVKVDKSNQYYVNNTKVAEEQLEEMLKRKLSGSNQQNIILNTDQTTETGSLVKVLDIAKRNHWKVALATKPL